MGEETRNKGTAKETAKTCCTPEAMWDFFRKMSAGCPGGGATDCQAMMKSMMEKFCGEENKKTGTGCGS